MLRCTKEINELHIFLLTSQKAKSITSLWHIAET